MELQYKKAIIKLYIEQKVKMGLDIQSDLSKLTKDRYKHWNFEYLEEFLLESFIRLGDSEENATRKLKALRNNY